MIGSTARWPTAVIAVAAASTPNVARIVAGVARGDIFERTWVAAKKGNVPAMTSPMSPNTLRVRWTSRSSRALDSARPAPSRIPIVMPTAPASTADT